MKALRGLGKIACVVVTTSCTSSPESHRDLVQKASTPLVGTEQERIVMDVQSVTSSGGERSRTAVGGLTFADYQRLARPWLDMTRGETLGEEASTQTFEDGTTLTRFRVTATSQPPAEPLPAASLLPRIGDHLRAALEQRKDDAPIIVSINLRDFPPFDIPLIPPTELLSDVSLEGALAARAEAIAARKEEYARRREPLLPALLPCATNVGSAGWASGSVTVGTLVHCVRALLGRHDVESIELSEMVWKDAGTIPNGIPLGDLGSPLRASWDEYHACEYEGGIANNGNNDLLIGFIEIGALEDEACFLSDGACGSSNRIHQRYDCLGGTCLAISNYPTADEGDHATFVASAAMAQYSEGQAVVPPLQVPNDPQWIPRSEGPATEAALVFFSGALPNATQTVESALETAIEENVDVLSMSQEDLAFGGPCSVVADEGYLRAAENAYDAGIFFAACTGNDGNANDLCVVADPAALPKVFTVPGLGTVEDTDCADDYRDCPLTGFRSGGASVAGASGMQMYRVLSVVDMAAPGSVGYMTNADGSAGAVSAYGSSGCSFATPIVAGAATIVKNRFLAQGNSSWIDLPGRLSAVMLTQTDRHQASSSAGPTSRAPNGMSRLWGAGRLKLAPIDAGHGTAIVTRSWWPSTADHTWVPWSTPLPTGTDVVKCVLYQVEDMSVKSAVSNLDLELELRVPVGGVCSSSGAFYMEEVDDSLDSTSLVAIDSGDISLGGKCAVVRTDNVAVVPWWGVTSHLVCTYSSILDDEPN